MCFVDCFWFSVFWGGLVLTGGESEGTHGEGGSGGVLINLNIK